MTPTPGTFFIRCLGDKRARFLRLADRQIAQNKEFLQLFLADLRRDIGV